jgi:preprotein translocase subunit SecF
MSKRRNRSTVRRPLPASKPARRDDAPGGDGGPALDDAPGTDDLLDPVEAPAVEVPADEVPDDAVPDDAPADAVPGGSDLDLDPDGATDADAEVATGAADAGRETPTDADADADVDATTDTGDGRGNGAVARRRARRAAASASGPGQLQAVKRSVWSRLYHGETNIDFVGRRRLWFGLSLALVAISLVSFATRGLNLGIDFEGGVVWEVPAGDASVADARDAVDQFGLADATIQELQSDEGREIRVESEPLAAEQSDQVSSALADLTGSSFDDVVINEVGPTWGQEISEKAIRALIVFMVLVSIYISFRFELKMAIATLAALVHDVIITVGVYSVTQLEVTPATVIAVLTILGYSIYDGIVVFDKVDENTRLVSSTGGLSYAGMVDVSLNQALMRSLNTTITALLPVGSLLVVGSWMMGASVLEEFALALLIGLFSGAYSSIFIASPLLAVLKEREPRYRDIKRRVADRGGDREVVKATVATGRPPSSRAAAAASPSGSSRAGAATVEAGTVPTVSPSGRVIPPRPRKKSRGPRR